MAIEAANRCRRFTGLDVVILNEVHQRRFRVAEPHHLKFHLFDILPDVDRLLYFDADLWFVAAWNPTEFPSLSAVRWHTYPPSATPSSLKRANQRAFDTARRGALQATEFATGRRTIHRQASVQAAASFDDGSLDFVVIDAERGHDSGHPRFPGVKPVPSQ